MAINGQINPTSFTDRAKLQDAADGMLIKAVHINELRTAIDRLNNTYGPKVDNCTLANCCQTCQNTCICQSEKCQGCQNACNQCTDKCEKCQESCLCQSSKCESCQDSCTQCFCQRQCNCNCSYDCQSH